MAEQMKTVDGVTAPASQFVEGAWLQGRQYNADTGTLGAPNQITVGPSAGTPVSSEVQTQSSKLQTPNNPEGVAQYFADYQNRIKGNLAGKDLTGSGTDKILGNAVNDARPAVPDLTATYNKEAAAYGVNDLNKSLNDLQAKAKVIQQSVIDAANTTENQPGVTADVVAGRESEQQREAQKQLDSLNLQITAVSTQLNTANNAISMFMNYAQQDYTNASQAYDTEVNQYIQMQQLINSEASTATAHSIATFNTIANHVADGSMDISKLSAADSKKLDTMQIAAGFPAGTIQSMSENALAKSRVGTEVKNLMTKAPQKVITSNPVISLGGMKLGGSEVWQYFNPLANNGAGAWESQKTQALAQEAQNAIINQVNANENAANYESIYNSATTQ